MIVLEKHYIPVKKYEFFCSRLELFQLSGKPEYKRYVFTNKQNGEKREILDFHTLFPLIEDMEFALNKETKEMANL